jgi:nitroreductase
LGNIWIDLFDRDVIRDEFDIPENLQPVCLLPMGYQTEDCPVSPLHYARKNLNEIVEER